MTITEQQTKPVTDLSSRAISVARAVDRLPPGTFIIRLVKDDVTGLPWTVVIEQAETVRVMELTKRENGG